MKLLYFDDFKLGVLKGDAVVDVSAIGERHPAYRPGRSDERADRAIGRLRAAARGSGGERHRRAGGERAHPPAVAEADARSTAWRSTTWKTARAARRRRSTPSTNRPPRSSAHGDTMVLPDVPAAIFEGEAEMAVIIGKQRQPCQRRQRDGLRLRLHQLHRRLGARPAAAGQRVLPDEVPRHLRADRALSRHRRRDQGAP